MTFIPLDRNAAVREQNDQLKQRFLLDSSQILVAVKGQFIGVNNQPRYFSYQQLIKKGWTTSHDHQSLASELLYLGQASKPAESTNLQSNPVTDYFVWLPSVDNQQLNQLLAKNQQSNDKLALSTINIRVAAMVNPDFDVNLLIYAKGLVNWHFKNTFCACCGHPSQISASGHSRTCHNSQCEQVHFPKIEPAVIFSIETIIDGESNLLLARQASWAEKRYSVVAGFSEVGETLEDSVKREAMEEVGLAVEKIQYIASQPWPFPASLMIAFQCETKQSSIRLLDKELEHAAWFSANKLTTRVQSGELLLPFSFSVSWQLIDRWYQQETGNQLSSLV
ncbi:MAG: NAD(+) diphosphatase [Enterobacterales bacterium]|nr:NAD(+) diphosphatase [Enterobacterales bacterium]